MLVCGRAQICFKSVTASCYIVIATNIPLDFLFISWNRCKQVDFSSEIKKNAPN